MRVVEELDGYVGDGACGGVSQKVGLALLTLEQWVISRAGEGEMKGVSPARVKSLEIWSC